MSRDRNLSIDLLKIIAMCLVVSLHTTHQFIGSASHVLSYVLYNFGVLAIPLFFMVSGYLLIGRADDGGYRYVFNKIFRIIRFIALMVIAFWTYKSIKSVSLDFGELAYDFVGVILQSGPFAIFWYLAAMCMIYMLYPLINRLYISNFYRYCLVLMFLLVLQNIIFLCNVTVGAEMQVIQTFRLWNWITFFMLGGIIHRVKYKPGVLYLLMVNGLALIPLTRMLYPYIGCNYCEYFYSSIFVVSLSFFFFLFVSNKKISNSKLIPLISNLFIPVYTLHIFVINHTTRVAEYLYDNVMGGGMYFIVVLLITVFISWVILKVPYMKNIFSI